MPTHPGIPLPFLPGGPQNPIDWLDLGGDEFNGIDQSGVMRGTPGAASWQGRQVPGPVAIPQAQPWFFHSRGYDRGAGAFAPQFGLLSYNPIGAGIYSIYKLPVIAGPGARYEFGAIFFDPQEIPTSIPQSPTISLELANMLVYQPAGTSYATTG